VSCVLKEVQERNPSTVARIVKLVSVWMNVLRFTTQPLGYKFLSGVPVHSAFE
jgi:hypothetical protein